MNEIMYFAMGSVSMLVLWSSVMFITKWVHFEKDITQELNEWMGASANIIAKKHNITTEDGRYYWWDENSKYYWWVAHDVEKHGPYNTFEEADKSCTAYAKSLETGNKSYGGFGIGGDSAYCFVTGEFIGADVIDSGGAKFTSEFDAWVSKEGQEILKDRNDNEAKVILKEWKENHE